MIETVRDLRAYIAADLDAHGIAGLGGLLRKPQARWQLKLRMLEYLTNRPPSLAGRSLKMLVQWRVVTSGAKLGFTIPANVFGPGLEIVHWGTIVVSGEARVGARARIHPSSSIGVDHGRAPAIGDEVYIGPGARIMGGIALGDQVTIGANAIVRQSHPDRVTIVGVDRVVGDVVVR
jgi:serine O-acetyltransferase